MVQGLNHDRLIELIADVEAAIRHLRDEGLDGIHVLENENLRLQRENRELRGELAQLKIGTQVRSSY